MHISFTPRGSPYVVVNSIAVNMKFYVGRRRLALNKYGREWTAMRNIWLNILHVGNLIVFKTCPAHISLDGATLHCSDYSMKEGIAEFGSHWWNVIYKMFIIESVNAHLFSFQIFPIPDLLLNGKPLNFMAQAKCEERFDRGAWHYVCMVWIKGLTLMEDRFGSCLDVSYDGKMITIKTPNGVSASLLANNRPVSEVDYPAIRNTLTCLSIQSGLCFMDDISRVRGLELSQDDMRKITEIVASKMQHELRFGAYMQPRYAMVDVHLYPLSAIVVSYL